MKKTSKKNKVEEKKVDEFQIKVNKAKEDLTVNIIQYNHKLERLLQEMSKTIQECINIDSLFLNQRELSSRNKMNIRVINSAIKMLDNNKIKLYMIDDKSLEEKVKNDIKIL